MAWFWALIAWIFGASKNVIVHEVIDTVAEVYQSLPEECKSHRLALAGLA